MTLYAYLEANKPAWREDLKNSVLSAIVEMEEEVLIKALLGHDSPCRTTL